MLNDIYYQLDEIIDDYECFKVVLFCLYLTVNTQCKKFIGFYKQCKADIGIYTTNILYTYIPYIIYIRLRHTKLQLQVQSVNDIYMLACGLDSLGQETLEAAKS